MSMSTIRIYRQLPIINGFVIVPPCQENNKSSILGEDAADLISGSAVVRLTGGSGRQRGSKCGQQEFLQLPPITPSTWYDTDPVSEID